MFGLTFAAGKKEERDLTVTKKTCQCHYLTETVLVKTYFNRWWKSEDLRTARIFAGKVIRFGGGQVEGGKLYFCDT